MTEKNHLETATLANGCFWCTETIFKRLKGVVSIAPGYAGGTVENPSWELVCTGRTGHAESIQIEFDPNIISFAKILDIFWHTHNPTTLNRQNYDVGAEYRSVIFYCNDMQKKLAEDSKKELELSEMYKSPIVTEIVPYSNFYKAEDYHQDFYEKNSYSPYCNIVIDPKLSKLLKEDSSDVKNEYKK